MRDTPRSERFHIGLFGRRNVGKSSLINLLTGQETALVSPYAGTTTDPVYKAMELFPLGPVVFVDTAGIDDEGDLGAQRVARTCLAMRNIDLALIVVEAGTQPGVFEEQLITTIKQKNIPVIGVINKTDLAGKSPELVEWLKNKNIPSVGVSAASGHGRNELLKAITGGWAHTEKHPSLMEGLIQPGETAVLVVPIDTGAPKGRLILPQVQTIRDILDHRGSAMVVTLEGLKETIERLKKPPKIVITDSQAFGHVAANVPDDIMLTSFSVLFARYKGRLDQLVEGAVFISRLRPGDRVLIAEGCTHHSQKDDIGRIKIPRWLNNIVGGPLEFSYTTGWDFPADLQDYRLVVHCGACMLNRREMMFRLDVLRKRGLYVVNYGVLIAYVHGILDKALEPFPDALALWKNKEGSH